jgi:uncharacterized protein
MSEGEGVLVSVRGEARRTVHPDSAVIAGTIAATRRSSAEAAAAAASALDSLIADLAELGGVALGVQTLRSSLTWSAHSAATRREHAHDKRTGQSEPTGLVTGTVEVRIEVRDFGLFGRLESHLSTHEAFSVHEVSWHVDWDNPGWHDVRAAAIQAAISKGHDYAAALGGQLITVEHIADPGLIGGGDGQHWVSSSVRSARQLAGGGGDAGSAPSLDPVPQELTALIEARFRAGGISLTPEA